MVWVAGTIIIEPSSLPHTSLHCIGRNIVAVNEIASDGRNGFLVLGTSSTIGSSN